MLFLKCPEVILVLIRPVDLLTLPKPEKVAFGLYAFVVLPVVRELKLHPFLGDIVAVETRQIAISIFE